MKKALIVQGGPGTGKTVIALQVIAELAREHEVVVGAYRPPDHRDVAPLVEKMCEWLRREFGFSEDAEPDFYTGVIEAIVAHVYLVWIHPFGDGNGRSARLLEFYLLLRGGLPDILFKSQNHQLKAYWKNYVHAELDGMRILKPYVHATRTFA